MRAVLVKDGKGPLENLYIGEAATPKPADGEVVVKVRDLTPFKLLAVWKVTA